MLPNSFYAAMPAPTRSILGDIRTFLLIQLVLLHIFYITESMGLDFMTFILLCPKLPLIKLELLNCLTLSKETFYSIKNNGIGNNHNLLKAGDYLLLKEKIKKKCLIKL